jgi:uncharacterized protein YcbK (DUF882 family)
MGHDRDVKTSAKGLALLLLAAIAAIEVAVTTPHAAPPGDRTLSLYNIHTKETLTVTYRKGGSLVTEAMKEVNWILRDWRRDESTQMDPALIDLIWEMHKELGSKEPVHVVSAFRSRATNDMLRKTVGGQASESRHVLGKAADVHFPDVPIRQLRYSAIIRERGGVGYYPASATPFVHVDTDSVRHWPRLPRQELALLFPSGRTRHNPDSGGPITREDAVAAKGNVELARVVADYFAVRATGRQPGATLVAVADAPPKAPAPVERPRVAAVAPPPAPVAPRPELVAAPRLAERPARFVMPTDADRDGLARLLADAQSPNLVAEPRLAQRPAPPAGPQVRLQLAAVDPADLARSRGGALSGRVPATAVAPAPEFDEEHPDELSYRPFPVAPLLTLTAAIDDPVLARLEHPDQARALELIGETSGVLPMRLSPGLAVIAQWYDQSFRGRAVNPAGFTTPGGSGARQVRTARQ